MSKVLSTAQIDRHLNQLADWTIFSKGTKIKANFKTKDYIEGLILLARITVRAEIMHHHPDVTVSYGKVMVVLTTHEAQGLTKKDFDLAEQIERIYNVSTR